jgi:putative ABC transport system permease protein
VHSIFQDVRQAARALRRSPLFTAVAVVSLGLGIGVNAGVFSIVDALLFRRLPWRDAGRLVDVYESDSTMCAGCGVGTSYPGYVDVRERARTLMNAAAYRTGALALELDEGAQRWQGAYVSARLFPLLGIAPLRGRALDEADEAPGADPVVLMGERLWRARFGEADVTGRAVRINGRLHTIVGVMPEALAFPPFADLWLPLAPVAAADARDDRSVGVIGRLADGATLAQARAEMAQIAAQNRLAYPATNAGWSGRVDPLRADLVSDYAPSFFLMLGIVAFVLLVACANVASLVLARAVERRQELAVRAAMGASRAALVRHVVSETLVLGLLAGGLAVLVAAWGLDAFASVVGGNLPSWIRYTIDGRVALFIGAVALVSALLAGLPPALQVAREDARRVLVDGGRGGTGGVERARLRRALVVVQVAAAMILVFGAAYLTNEFLRITRFDPGHDTAGLYHARLTILRPPDSDPRGAPALVESLLERFAASAGTRDVALSSMYIPNWPGTPASEIRIPDAAIDEPGGAIHRVYNVTPAYFRTLGIDLISGRDFRESDRAGAPPVGIIGRKLADRLWPEQSPLGRQIHLGGPGDDWITIVGVVPSVRASPFARDTSQLLYLPLAQHPVAQPLQDEFALDLRPAAAPANLELRLRGAAAQVDPAIVVEDVGSAHEQEARAIAPVRMTALATGGLGLFAVLLAAMGIFGVIAFTVSRRTPEIGVRIALGAAPAGIVRMVLRQALSLAATGLALGTCGSIALGGVMRNQLGGTRSIGVVPFAGVLFALLAVALLAGWIPARRAARIDPAAAVRAEG